MAGLLTARLSSLVGQTSSPELQRRPRDYHAARKAAGLPTRPLAFQGRDRFSIFEKLASLTGEPTNAVVQLAKFRLPMEERANRIRASFAAHGTFSTALPVVLRCLQLSP